MITMKSIKRRTNDCPLKELEKLLEELVLLPEGGRERREITMAMAYSKE